MSSINKLDKASDFQPLPGEANFPPSITTEVVGGVHIAPECMTVHSGKFVMTVWPSGLPRHETEKTVRFPHGLMQFGETMEQCAERLVKNQMGYGVVDVRVLKIDSYVDDMNHWHIEPILLVQVDGSEALPSEASGTMHFSVNDLPDESVWGRESFQRVCNELVAPILPNIAE